MRLASQDLPGGLVGVNLLVGDRTDVYAADVRIAYDPGVVAPVDVQATTPGVLLASNLLQEGLIIVASASAGGLVGPDGGILALRFRITGKPPVESALRLQRISLFDVTAAPVSVRLAQRLELPRRAVPGSYGLSPGYPNPFNPSTELRIQLPESGDVAVNVYNLNGQVVRSLLHGHRPAGVWRVVWDGRDQKGQMVSSGVYIVGMKAGQHAVVRKVTLIR